MHTRNQTIIPLSRLDIQRMVFEVVRRLRVPLNEAFKWEYETCYNEAKKYKSQKEFQRNSSGAFNAAYKNGWLKDYTWFKRPVAYNKKWTYETCYNEAKKYKSRNEFRKGNNSAYTVAWKNGWLKDYTWFEGKQYNPKGYWDYDKCYGEAKKYKSRKEFQTNSHSAYDAARKNGWLDDYTWFQKRVKSDKSIYVVYCYKDEDTNSIYIGLTNNVKRRHGEHRNGTNKHGVKVYDTVYKYYKSIGKEPPEPIILKDNLSSEEAQKYEAEFVEQFKKEGLNVLNLAKPGSLGAYSKWTKEKCYDEAKKYDTLLDFRKNAKQAYTVSRKNGWINDYTWLKRLNGFWNRETCYDEAKKYKTRREFQKNSGGAYVCALKNGWLDDYTWFESKQKPNGYWSRESCYEEAKKYKSRTEFCKKAKGAYNAACLNGWLDDYTWFSPSQSAKKWNRETCYEEAKKYKTIGEFSANSGRAYQIAKKNGWINDYTWLERKHKQDGYWNRETCYEEAKKYNSRSELAKNNMSVYNIARKNGWLDDYTWFKEATSKPKGYWTYEKCYEEAKNYNSRNEFSENNHAAYTAAWKNGWLDDYTWFKKPLRSNQAALG